MLLLLGLYDLGLHAMEVTVCDCSATADKRILHFSDENCFSEPNPNKTNEVKYEVYTEKREGIKFSGYLCAKWKQIKHVTTSFFGQKVVVPDKLELETSLCRRKNPTYKKKKAKVFRLLWVWFWRQMEASRITILL